MHFIVSIGNKADFYINFLRYILFNWSIKCWKRAFFSLLPSILFIFWIVLGFVVKTRRALCFYSAAMNALGNGSTSRVGNFIIIPRVSRAPSSITLLLQKLAEERFFFDIVYENRTTYTDILGKVGLIYFYYFVYDYIFCTVYLCG